MTASRDGIVVDRTPGGLLVRTAGEEPAAGPGPRDTGTAVAAADGPVLALPGGEAFAAGPTGRWWWFPPGGPATSAGARSPVPAWAAELVRALPADVRGRPRLLAAGPEPDALRVAGAGLAAELGLRAHRVRPDGEVSEIVVPPARRPAAGGRHRARVPSVHDGPVSDGLGSDGRVFGCG